MRTKNPVVLLMLLVSCVVEGPSAASTTRDSAGVHVIESERASGRAWLVDSFPSLIIGSEENGPDYQLYRVRDVHRMADGSILVANSGASELRVYDRHGAFLRRVGRKGAGPGEFGEFSSLQTWLGRADSLTVSDSGNERINIFTAEGVSVRTVRLEPTERTPRVRLMDVFADGTWLVMGPVGGGILQGAPGSVIGMEFSYMRYSPAGEHLNDVMGVEGRPRYVHETGGTTHYPFIPFAQPRLAVTQGDRLVMVTVASTGLERRNVSGELEDLLRWDMKARVQTRDVWDRYRAVALDGVTSERTLRLYSRYFEEPLPLPEYVPMADALLIDSVGHIWVKRHLLPWHETSRWDVLTREGVWTSTVHLPRGFTPYEIGDDYLAGVARDELGVEQVQVLTLRRS